MVRQDRDVNSGAKPGHWDNKFEAIGDRTRVTADLSFDDEATIKLMLEMGFEGGFTMGLNQLEELLG